jgi:hypothetical protein
VAGYGFGTESRVFVDRYYSFEGGVPENSYIGMFLQLGAVGVGVFVALLASLVVAGGRALVPAERQARVLAATCGAVLLVGLALGLFQSYLYAAGNNATLSCGSARFSSPLWPRARGRPPEPPRSLQERRWTPPARAGLQPVLLARSRGDRAPAARALQRAGRRVRRHCRHGPPVAVAASGGARPDGARGVEIVRVRSTAYERSRLALRAVNYATYLAESLRVGLSEPRPDVVLCMTDPPVIADVALAVARRYSVPLVVISQDVFPEIAVELKRLENPFLVGVLRRAIGFYLSRAERVVAIGETMQRRLEEKGARPERLRVIPTGSTRTP